VLQLADRIYVMKDGAVVAELMTAEANVTRLHQLMVGRTLQADYYREPSQKPFQPRVLLEVEELSLGKAYRDVSFKLRAGEILGIAGVIGSGREELTRTLAGFAPHDGGRLRIADREARLTTPAEAVDLGIGYVPRERRVEGLVLFLSVSANITLAALSSLTRWGLIDAREERRRAESWVDRLKVRTPNISALCLNLSGGNQQKVVLAKWLSMAPRVVMFDEPTRGIDVGSKSEIYRLMRGLADSGVAVLMISSDMEEVIGVSDRIVVMREGRIAGFLERSGFSEENVMRLAVGRHDMQAAETVSC
jgi:ribose transport system ATP-binding protein